MSKLLTVFGATGNQGGSVIKTILADPELSKEFQIRAVTRNASKPAARSLAEQGIEVKTADMNSKDSVASVIAGSHTVFLVTNFWETRSLEAEVSQGRNVADAARDAGVSQLIFSSLLDVSEHTGGRLAHVPHFDAKAAVERYIRSICAASSSSSSSTDEGGPGLGACTFVLPGYFMSNLPDMLRLVRQGDESASSLPADEGMFTLAYPFGPETRIPLIDPAEDTGKFVKAAIKHAAELNGKRLLAAAGYYTPERILEEFEEVTGNKTAFMQVSPEQYRAYLPANVAQEMLETHLFIADPGYYAGESLEESLKLLDEKPTTWKEFVRRSNASGAFQG
ncbi:hypothetical protein VTJ49DRAFT_6427 [Mycothermus thermophilus]|uniref:NmrA-like domain-containing protein n=1 Tax=Humicola insolens TaxID=85995 RepID=A0ABR3VJ34_HUMIN